MNTRDRLLQAAIQAFAEAGYEKTTIAGISGRAGANIAAVNYHFRSKENLYVEAWRTAFAEAMELHPADGGVPPDAPARERFAGRVRAVVARMLDPVCLEVDIAAKEMANPTGLLQDAIHTAVGPFRRAMEETLGELLGPAAPSAAVRLCSMSVMSQCLHLMVMRQRPGGPRPGLPPLPPAAELGTHIVAFSLGGVDAVRRLHEGAPGEHR